MAQLTYRANLSAKIFPMLSYNWGRTVIIPQMDQTFNRELSSQEDEDRDVGIPQIYYCHNVLPTAQGFQSIGYAQAIAPAGGLPSDFIEFYNISTVTAERIILGLVDTRSLYIQRGGLWNPVFSVGATCDLSIGFVQEAAYIYASGEACYRYHLGSGSIDTITLAGLTATLIDGITSAAGYLIAWSRALDSKLLVGTCVLGSPVVTALGSTTDLYAGQTIEEPNFVAPTTIISVDSPTQITLSTNAIGGGLFYGYRREVPSQVLWSSTLDPTDFVPSLITGAGGGAVEVARGEITQCIPHTLGFFIFTTRNIVAALYTNNARYPFQFREIVNSGGVTAANRVAADTNSGNIYAYTSSGIQMINSTQAQTIFPDVTDFLAGSILEDFDEVTDTFSTTTLADLMQVRLVIVADRYLVISYGISEYTHALVYDISMRRWGKLKYTHVKCMDDTTESQLSASFPKKSILFMTANGTGMRWVFDTDDDTAVGVIILGKYQYVRSRLLQLDEVNIEQVRSTAPLVVKDLPALDGRNTSTETGYLMDNTGGFRKYLFNTVGLNHSLLLRGAFNLISLVLTFSIHGKR